MRFTLPASVAFSAALVAAAPLPCRCHGTDGQLSTLSSRSLASAAATLEKRGQRGAEFQQGAGNYLHNVPRFFNKMTQSKEDFNKGQLAYHTEQYSRRLQNAEGHEDAGRMRQRITPEEAQNMGVNQLHRKIGIHGKIAREERNAASWHYEKMIKYGHKPDGIPQSKL